MAQFQFIDPRKEERRGPAPIQEIMGGITGGLGAMFDAYGESQQQEQQQEQLQQKAVALAQALNVPVEQAAQILMQDPGIQKELLQAQIKAPMQENFASLAQQLLGGAPEEGLEAEGGELEQAGIPSGGKVTESQLNNLIKYKQKQQQLQQQADAPQLREELKEISEFKKGRRGAAEEKQALKEVSQLAESGKLKTAGLPRQIMEKLGFGDVGLNTPEQVVNKLMSKLSVDKLQALGGRPTVALLGEIRKIYPSLLNTPEGIKEISGMIQDTIQMEGVIEKELDKLSKKNKGRYPLQAMNKAFENSEDKRNKIIERREKRLRKLMDKEESKRPDPRRIKRYRDSETGIVYISDGQQFVPEGR